MFRRLVNVVLLAGGAVPLAWVLWTHDLGLRRTVVVGALVAVGAAFNVTGLVRRTVGLRPWLRLLAVLVGLAALAGVLALRWSTQETLASVSPTNPALRTALAAAVRGSWWLAAALVYAVVSVLLLPKCAPTVRPEQPT